MKDGLPTNSNIDVLILTASVESLEAVMAVEAPGSSWIERHCAQGFLYFERNIAAESGEILTWAVTRLADNGDTTTKAKLLKILDALQPAQLAFCGGCFAKKNADVSLGDVIVADRVHAKPSGLDYWLVGEAPEVPANVQPLTDWGTDVAWFGRKFEQQSPLATLKPSLQQGKTPPPAQSSNPPFRVWVKSVADCHSMDFHWPDVLAYGPNLDIAMEMPQPYIDRWLVVLGVRAFTDGPTDPAMHAFARRASAVFATDFLRRFALSRSKTQSLPRPAPLHSDVPEDMDDAPYLRGLKLQSLRISGLRNIESLELNLHSDSSLPGFWTCIAGLNGAGKSSVLQAIVIALLGDGFAPELGRELLKRARRRVENDTLICSLQADVLLGEKREDVLIQIDDEGAGTRRLKQNGSARSQRFWSKRAKKHILLAYGPGRNLSEYLDTRHRDKSIEVRRVMTLFDPLTQVASADAILGHEKNPKPVLTLLRGLVESVFSDVDLHIEGYEDGLRFRMGHAVLGAVDLPDGYRASLAWMADLCAVWATMYPDEALAGNPADIQALVLIDEIDLHLHPRLQRILVPRLRKALPLVQWIVSTHSPLVISSFDRHEIVMLELDEQGRVHRRELDRQILGFSADEVYQWLMETEPKSEAFKQIPLDGSPEQRRRLADLMAVSPEMSEEDVARSRAYREQRLKELGRGGGGGEE